MQKVKVSRDVKASPQQQGVGNKINLKTDDGWESNLYQVPCNFQKWVDIWLQFKEI